MATICLVVLFNLDPVTFITPYRKYMYNVHDVLSTVEHNFLDDNGGQTIASMSDDNFC